MYDNLEMINTNNESLSTFDDDDELIPIRIKFWIYLFFLIPSLFCSLFVLYYLLCHRNLRNALHNHTIIIFLLIGLLYEITIYPWMLYLYHQKGIWERNYFFCTVWIFIDWGLYYTQTILFAWATIERHILIFHHRWLTTRIKRFFLHYFPFIFLMTYCLIYYSFVIFSPTCQHQHDSHYTICVELCSFYSTSLYIYENVTHQILPNVIIVVSNIALLCRIYRQKLRVGQSLQWRKHWKMTVQLLFVSIIYLLFALPLTLMHFIALCGFSSARMSIIQEYFLFFNYCMLLLCPFACALSLPKLRDKIKNICLARRQARIIVPITWNYAQTLHR